MTNGGCSLFQGQPRGRSHSIITDTCMRISRRCTGRTSHTHCFFWYTIVLPSALALLSYHEKDSVVFSPRRRESSILCTHDTHTAVAIHYQPDRKCHDSLEVVRHNFCSRSIFFCAHLKKKHSLAHTHHHQQATVNRARAVQSDCTTPFHTAKGHV